MGLALGSMGMSLDDFCRLTPREMEQAWRQWHRTHVEEPWERTRLTALCLLQPWSKKKLRATDVMAFPWDTPRRSDAHPAQEPSTRQRFEELRRRCGEG